MNLWQAMKVVWKVSVVTISLTSCVIVIFCDHLSNYNDIVKIIIEVLSVSVGAPPDPCTMILLQWASIPSYGAATITWMSNSLSPPVSTIQSFLSTLCLI